MIELRRRNLSSVTNALLPKEYQQVEYLQTDGTANILFISYVSPSLITTNFNSDTWRIICDAEIIEWAANRAIFGKSEGSYGSIAMITNEEELTYSMFLDKSVKTNIYSLPSFARHIYSISGKYFRVDDEIVTQYANSFGKIFNIFGFNHSAGVMFSYPLVSRIYNFKIENEGVALADFYPCYRKADGVAGMFDIVQGIFHVNSNTKGQFSVGKNV